MGARRSWTAPWGRPRRRAGRSARPDFRCDLPRICRGVHPSNSSRAVGSAPAATRAVITAGVVVVLIAAICRGVHPSDLSRAVGSAPAATRAATAMQGRAILVSRRRVGPGSDQGGQHGRIFVEPCRAMQGRLCHLSRAFGSAPAATRAVSTAGVAVLPRYAGASRRPRPAP